MTEKEKGKKRFELEILRIALAKNYNETPLEIRDALRKLLFSFDEMIKEEIEILSHKKSGK